MIFNLNTVASGGGGATLHTLTAPGNIIYCGGYEDGTYVGVDLVSSADFPEGVTVRVETNAGNIDVGSEEYPEGGFTEIWQIYNETYCFMMPPFDCWIISE